MITLYDIKILDRLLNMAIKIPNFARVNVTDNFEFKDYTIVDNENRDESDLCEIFSKRVNMIRDQIGQIFLHGNIVYKIEDIKCFNANPIFPGDVPEEYEKRLILNPYIITVSMENRMEDKMRFFKIPVLITERCCFTIKNALHLLTDPFKDPCLEDMIPIIDYDLINFDSINKETYNLAEVIATNVLLTIPGPELKIGMLYESLGELFTFRYVEDLSDDVKGALRDSAYRNTYMSFAENEEKDRYVPLIVMDDSDFSVVNEYAALADGKFVINRLVSASNTNDEIIVLNSRNSDFVSYEYELLERGLYFIAGHLFSREETITKGENGLFVNGSKWYRDTTLDPVLIRAEGFAYYSKLRYTEYNTYAENVLEDAKDKVKGAFADYINSVKRKKVKKEVDAALNDWVKHLMTVLGSASLVTGNFGLGIAIFVGKLFNKAFKETNMGSNMTQRHYKDLYAKLADIISDLEEKMEEARNDKKLKKARDIKKSLDHFKRLQEQIEKKAGKEFTKGMHRSQGFADQGPF